MGSGKKEETSQVFGMGLCCGDDTPCAAFITSHLSFCPPDVVDESDTDTNLVFPTYNNSNSANINKSFSFQQKT
ncbi:hypothetical protein RUM43_001042 [Polyplax serrata]|uniref:Uncharacterized protein n=1 Tax=Polyplax serrata TaxID=468196 RepID=A0AAN8XPK6_POLSC